MTDVLEYWLNRGNVDIRDGFIDGIIMYAVEKAGYKKEDLTGCSDYENKDNIPYHNGLHIGAKVGEFLFGGGRVSIDIKATKIEDNRETVKVE